jgi:hypothetical protein
MMKHEATCWRLRDLARSVAVNKGASFDHDGVGIIAYADKHIRIEYTPAVSGASNPSVIEVWKIGDRATRVLNVFWNGRGSDFIIDYESGSWEDALGIAAGAAPRTGITVPMPVARAPPP